MASVFASSLVISRLLAAWDNDGDVGKSANAGPCPAAPCTPYRTNAPLRVPNWPGENGHGPAGNCRSFGWQWAKGRTRSYGNPKASANRRRGGPSYATISDSHMRKEDPLRGPTAQPAGASYGRCAMKSAHRSDESPSRRFRSARVPAGFRRHFESGSAAFQI